MTSRYAVAFAALACVGCRNLDTTQDDLRKDIASHRTRWDDHRPAAYVYELRRTCTCSAEATGPARIRVRGTEVVERTYTESGAPVLAGAVGLFPSVDGLFDLLEDALEREAWQVQIAWDAESGAPLDFYIDYDGRYIEDDLGVRIVAVPVPEASS